jgi:hypothetical protein
MNKQHAEHRRQNADPGRPSPAPINSAESERQEDEQSLDLVQRVVASALVIVIGLALSAGLTAYAALSFGPDQSGTVGLWIMTGVAGLLVAAAVLVINRRHPYSPLILIGLLPMALSAYWIFT